MGVLTSQWPGVILFGQFQERSTRGRAESEPLFLIRAAHDTMCVQAPGGRLRTHVITRRSGSAAISQAGRTAHW